MWKIRPSIIAGGTPAIRHPQTGFRFFDKTMLRICSRSWADSWHKKGGRIFWRGLEVLKCVWYTDLRAGWKARLTCGAGFLACYSCERDARTTFPYSIPNLGKPARKQRSFIYELIHRHVFTRIFRTLETNGDGLGRFLTQRRGASQSFLNCFTSASLCALSVFALNLFFV